MPTKLDEQFEKALEKKFFCPTKFAQEIETLVLDNKNMNYIDAIIHFCDANSIDLESVPKLISKPLKEKIKFDATELNFSNEHPEQNWFFNSEKVGKNIVGIFHEIPLSRL